MASAVDDPAARRSARRGSGPGGTGGSRRGGSRPARSNAVSSAGGGVRRFIGGCFGDAADSVPRPGGASARDVRVRPYGRPGAQRGDDPLRVGRVSGEESRLGRLDRMRPLRILLLEEDIHHAVQFHRPAVVLRGVDDAGGSDCEQSSGAADDVSASTVTRGTSPGRRAAARRSRAFWRRIRSPLIRSRCMGAALRTLRRTPRHPGRCGVGGRTGRAASRSASRNTTKTRRRGIRHARGGKFFGDPASCAVGTPRQVRRGDFERGRSWQLVAQCLCIRLWRT